MPVTPPIHLLLEDGPPFQPPVESQLRLSGPPRLISGQGCLSLFPVVCSRHVQPAPNSSSADTAPPSPYLLWILIAFWTKSASKCMLPRPGLDHYLLFPSSKACHVSFLPLIVPSQASVTEHCQLLPSSRFTLSLPFCSSRPAPH